MQFFKSPAHSYLFFVSLSGIIVFASLINPRFYHYGDLVTILLVAGTILMLNYFMIELPPKGNHFSMDSSIFLGVLFLFGLQDTLAILFLFAIIFALILRTTAWWKHIFNFGMYTLMISSAYYVYLISGGVIGEITIKNLFPTIFSFIIYFTTNIILIGVYFILSASGNLNYIVKGLIIEPISTYIVTMLLSQVLVILINSQKMYGLFLFICISILLSFAFKQHFKLFKEISEKANKDFLTDLNNHGYFKELLEKNVKFANETGHPLSLALLDIDDFKKYNDLYGHIPGDQLLKEFGHLLKKIADERNFIVARYGGEEFTILMPNTNRNEAFHFVNDLRKKANDTYFYGVEGLPYGCFSFSAGIAEWEKGILNISDLIHKADLAMYSAKEHGKNLVHLFNEQTDYSVQKSLNLEKDLEEAEQQLKIFLSKDVYTYRHSKRVYQYAVDFSKKLQLTEQERKTLILGALIHDIGKLEIPRDIINKKGKLDPHEWEIMKKHVTWGKEIISTNKKFEDLIPLVELHHERFDGNGYPYGLKGKTIPKLSRILCVIDSFDAMTTERPYQKTKTFKEAIIELRACAGKQFDPQFVEPFIELIEQLDAETCVGTAEYAEGV
ncbi:bifunctional diguanylate cyclase/phosphohydrolase [Neobacillus sp. SM06]|uniref:bifunctional diguanylate cyclase/phosphohydrolase n=1 Tax=Neobacillus sp. SM06 TaxID=3422492 RepID=UPI003D2C6F2B